MATNIEQSKALFVRRWGEMAAYWGISRTMAEIHALLFASPDPLCTDDIMEQLAISRGNASMNLRALVDWGLIDRNHQRGDRKEYFTARPDVWEMFETITRQRKRREVEPIIDTIQRCCRLADEDIAKLRGDEAAAAKKYRERMADMLQFLTVVGNVLDLILRMGPRSLKALNSTLGRLAG